MIGPDASGRRVAELRKNVGVLNTRNSNKRMAHRKLWYFGYNKILRKLPL